MLLILGLGTLGFVLAQTTVIPALSDLQRELDTSATGITWMITAYLLVASIATPVSVPYPVALAVIAGVLDLVPNIGSLIAGIIVAAVSLTVGFGAAVAFVVVVLLYQQFENYVLQPTIVGRAADVPGFFVIASVLVFGGLFGVAETILGVPIFAAVQIVVREVTASRRQAITRAEISA